VFLPQCERLCFIPHKTSGNLHFNLYIFGKQTERQKILDQMVSGIPWVQSILISSWMQFQIVRGFPNIWNLLRFQRIYCLYLRFHFVMHFWSGGTNTYVAFLIFAFRPTSYQRVKTASVFFFIACLLSPTKLISST
jgi:hypothetical protein